jgi:hypothetical protein
MPPVTIEKNGRCRAAIYPVAYGQAYYAGLLFTGRLSLI